MSRPLHFRVWHNVRVKYVSFHMLEQDGELCIEGKYGGIASVPKDDVLIEWFTGLLDSKGREIYEGDILTGGAVVEWFDRLVWDGTGSPHPGFWCKQWFIHPTRDQELNWHEGFGAADVEVIGNVHEHPTLIRAL